VLYYEQLSTNALKNALTSKKFNTPSHVKPVSGACAEKAERNAETSKIVVREIWMKWI